MFTVQAGDHLGIAIGYTAGFTNATRSFVQQAIDAGAMAIVFPGELTGLAAEGLTAEPDLRPAYQSGQFTLADSNAVQLAPGRFDVEYLHQTYAGATRQALDAGFTGLWVSVDMTWARPDVVDPQELITFEAQAFPLFRDQTLTAMCVYDTRIFSWGTAKRACAAHPASLRSAVMRSRYEAGTLVLSGETDLTNRIAFTAIIDSLADGDTVDLTGLGFIDAGAAEVLARVVAKQARTRLRVTGFQADLLSLTGVSLTQMQVQ